MVEEKKNELERYSFSKLNSFHTCKYGYKLRYIDHLVGITNCFSSYGILVHSIMERYANKLLTLDDLSNIYEWEFSTAVPEPFPKSSFCKNMRDLYYEQGLDFLTNFKGYGDSKILCVEKQFDFQIDDWIFNGVIDLVYETPDGKLILQDYKSKSSFKSKKEQKEYARQLYLYSLHIKETYGKYPDTLRFYMFRKNTIVDIPFNEKDFEEAVEWAKSTVQEIRGCWVWNPTCDKFFSENLCNHREYCTEKIKEE